MAKTFIFDFDSTIVQCEALDELARLALDGKPDADVTVRKIQNLTNEAMSGKLAFDEALSKRIQLFSASEKEINLLIEKLLRKVSPSALAAKEWFRANRENIYVISGGFEDYIVPIVERLHIKSDHVFANRFLFDESGSILGFDTKLPLSKAKGKVAQLQALKLPRPIVMIGDGYSDYEVKEHGEADEFWAFIETANRPTVTEKADKIVNNFLDFTGETPAI